MSISTMDYGYVLAIGYARPPVNNTMDAVWHYRAYMGMAYDSGRIGLIRNIDCLLLYKML